MWGNKMKKNKLNKLEKLIVVEHIKRKSFAVWVIALITMLAVFGIALVGASTDTTNPTIISTSPMNNEKDVGVHDPITVFFSEEMDYTTINNNTFVVMQRTTPPGSEVYRWLAINGNVTYADRTATFISNDKFTPNQQYGNVFTVDITTGAQDLSGNPISQDYMWSFTTGIHAFNTGNSTSQENQSQNESSAIITVPVVVPPSIQPPVVTAPESNSAITTTSTFPWAWVIGGAFLLLIITLAIISFAGPVSQKNTVGSSHISRPSPFGDVLPVMDLEGIGPKYSKGLHAMGIRNTKQLWEANPAKVARGTGASIGSVKSWQHMAELASVKDIGPQYAELLERSGVHSIGQLKNANADELLSAVREKENSLKINIQGNSPGHTTVEHWIEEARDHTFTNAEEGQTA
jgi:predicted flap endonuclease-1-like 5' DNA nuclease